MELLKCKTVTSITSLKTPRVLSYWPPNLDKVSRTSLFVSPWTYIIQVPPCTNKIFLLNYRTDNHKIIIITEMCLSQINTPGTINQRQRTRLTETENIDLQSKLKTYKEHCSDRNKLHPLAAGTLFYVSRLQVSALATSNETSRKDQRPCKMNTNYTTTTATTTTRKTPISILMEQCSRHNINQGTTNKTEKKKSKRRA